MSDWADSSEVSTVPEPEEAPAAARTLVDEYVVRLWDGERVLIPAVEPGQPGAVYRLSHAEGRCPHIEVYFSPEGTRWLAPCISCCGFPCEGCEDEGDKTSLARAIIGAILAGRSVRTLGPRRVVSSGVMMDRYGRGEVAWHGEGSAEQASRDGRAEEPEAPVVEDGPDLFLPYTVGVDVSEVGAIDIVTDADGTRFQLRRGDGLVKEILFEDAWRALADPRTVGWR